MAEQFRENLIRWYRHAHRDLPWRRTRDPYPVWLSEIMLQQTRVAAVLPYYERFLARYPRVEDLAAAPEEEVLQLWAGLGYYSRARNLHRAARAAAAAGGFPESYEALRALPGVGAYTAAAVASIAFGLPHAVVDGNVLRVIARLKNDGADIGSPATRKRFEAFADDLLDRERPAEFNQAMMELGATICLPRNPLCLLCPVAGLCEGRRAGREKELPVKLRRIARVAEERTLLAVEKAGTYLFWQRPPDSSLMPGFWELPEPDLLPEAEIGEEVGAFAHSITNHDYRFTVLRAEVAGTPANFRWLSVEERWAVPLSTVARKALKLLSPEPKPGRSGH